MKSSTHAYRLGTCIGINSKLYKALLVSLFFVISCLENMAASVVATARTGHGRVRPHLAGPAGRQDKTYEIRSVVLKKKITALLVDGDRFCRMIQKGLLCHHRVETEAVDNGQSAVDLLASGATFTLVIIDINLPQLSGLEVTRQIRAMGIPTWIIGMSFRFRQCDIDAFIEAGANLVIEKPLVPETLVPILLELIHEI